MYNKILTGILVVLLIGIVGTLAYLGYGYYDKFKKEKDGEKYIDEDFEQIVVSLKDNEQNNTEPQENQNQNSNQNNGQYSNNTDISSGYYKGYKVAGKLEIPKLGKRFVILDEPTKAQAIEVSILKVYGVQLNTPGNVVIAGHNYNNGTFFSKNKNLNVGDKLYITDLTGNRVSYTIFSKYYTPESDNSYYTRDTNGNVEVTLYTCDATGANRLIICARAD